jgi:diguanylate cyclase (GGDEF)-like protein/PAS domain S-box-containing protein
MHQLNSTPERQVSVPQLSEILFNRHRNKLFRTTDRLFVGLLAFQWLAAIVTALVISPITWAGASTWVHPHIWAATALGGVLVSLPSTLALTCPGMAITRHSIAAAQMLMGALLIHLTGGRIETHFHIFGSLAFLAFYRDWTVLISASIVAAADHLLRGIFWPQSIYGILMIQPWRWVEHTGWVVFDDLFLVWSCRKSMREMQDIAERQATLEILHSQIEQQVAERTAELRESKSLKASIIRTALDAIVTIDHLGRVVEFNPAAEKIFGYSKDETKGQRLDELIIPPQHRQPHRGTLAAFSGTDECQSMGHRIELLALRGDGTEFPAELSINPVIRDAALPLFVGFARDITERKQAEERLAYQATHDALTGLPNRALFQSELERYFGSHEGDRTFALLMVDLDRFKEVNDTFGHHYGDLLLQGLGPHLRDALCGLGMLARIGGDEFGILLPGADGARAIQAAEAILAAVRQPIVVKGQALDVGASIGVALCPDHTNDPSVLMQCADIAMYAAKRVKTGYLIYAADQSELTPRRMTMISELRQGIKQDQLRLHYQPKINLRTFAVEGVEALVRWQHPGDGLLPPGEFIGMAEDTRLITPLSLWVLRTALLQCRIWHQTGVRVNFAVNLAASMLKDRDLVKMITAQLESSDALPEWLTLEITESAVMTDPVRARETLAQLRRIGMRISIDDFGTGYSSLAYLRDLPVDEIKIDRSFVKEMSSSEKDVSIVRSIIDLGHNLGLQVVAEGVEDQATVELLTTMGCDYVQGFHFTRPLPAVEFASWLAGTRGPGHRALYNSRGMQSGRQSLLRSEPEKAGSGPKP